MGLRNFNDLNDALLAKQCWRLIHNLNSLWAMVLKARYFSHCSFFNAKCGSMAYWAWHSLLVDRDLLMKGSHWQVMDDCFVCLWLDRCLPTIPLGHPNPGSVSVTRDTRVASLLSSSTCSWDISFLQPFLSVKEQTAILATPIGNPMTNDCLVWSSTKTRLYVVKLSYH